MKRREDKPAGVPRVSQQAWALVEKLSRLRPSASYQAIAFLSCRVLVRPDGGGVEQQPAQVHFLQLFEDTLPDAFAGPAPEALVGRIHGP